MKDIKVYVKFGVRVIGYVLRRMPIIKNNYRLRNSVDLITYAANICEKHLIYATNNTEVLHIELKKLGIKFNDLPESICSDLIKVIANVNQERIFYINLNQLLTRQSAILLPCKQWLHLNKLLCFRGRYALAHVCREKARQLALDPIFKVDAKPPISWSNSIAAFLEGSECQNQKELSLVLERAGIKNNKVKKWHLLFSLLNSKHVSHDLTIVFDNTGYANFINNKSVAIVGPAVTEAKDADEIDSSDVVIRLNHRLSGNGTDTVHKGTRTDISCFNRAQEIAFTKELLGVLPFEITWACFKWKSIVNDLHIVNPTKYCRGLVMFDDMTFHGFYNMMPIVAMDLAIFNCGSIKVFHTDLMLTFRRQDDYYYTSFKPHPTDMRDLQTRSLAMHDPVLQYRALNKLWSSKKVYGDSRFEEVMQMGLDNYLSKLECVYSNGYKDSVQKVYI